MTFLFFWTLPLKRNLLVEGRLPRPANIENYTAVRIATTVRSEMKYLLLSEITDANCRGWTKSIDANGPRSAIAGREVQSLISMAQGTPRTETGSSLKIARHSNSCRTHAGDGCEVYHAREADRVPTARSNQISRFPVASDSRVECDVGMNRHSQESAKRSGKIADTR
ncbi:MAG: hypothetical protein WD648_06500 [Planctomycetaceae bacterium]